MQKKDFTVLPHSIQKWFVNILDPFIDIIIRFHVHPNHFTILGLFISIIGAVFYAKHDIRLGGFFILLGGLADIIDGKVARKTGLSTKFGALFDSSLDRYSELFMFLGTAIYFVQQNHPITSIMIFLGLGGSMMVSYVRARAEGLGYDCKVGIMQRPERVVYIGFSSLIHPYLLEVVIWMIAILANFTAIQRMYHVWNLERQEKNQEMGQEHQNL
ncbi:MAG: CDP-alcohol phosphatidyltransferase family protein [Calditrichaeota bacterium]|nr:CDP-alcohol phosphatidyltransferase family protein [Calditrichota bacterium]RQV92308.1 MAG: CDP-alcohol phosphatidyltransferase family protein [bacterium]RQV98137.1 MAG: CDP-alcohol phosphatidyltransferase family protein [Calditrichota bacterium]